ncbi:hypothetical protein KQX54_016055 [Cotesia glomerata]|uniref:Uncharacterized protein n=1 Tax=Cotesia glomerata TaxID=32391 RepID=A0AAV7J7S5_COTGL|nr:hypothetical protein KQX54_016055 [Cotesia glomerata]
MIECKIGFALSFTLFEEFLVLFSISLVESMSDLSSGTLRALNTLEVISISDEPWTTESGMPEITNSDVTYVDESIKSCDSGRKTESLLGDNGELGVIGAEVVDLCRLPILVRDSVDLADLKLDVDELLEVTDLND